MPRILGREPALWLALVAVAVKLGAAFGLRVTDDQQALVNAAAAALVGLVVALVVHDGRGAAVLGLVQAALALAVGYGLHWSADQQAVALSAVAAVVAMWTRTQVTAPVPPARQLPPILAVRE
ncbi:hypothetical protein ACFYST_06015 [Kitasatospora sp. NPDC004614]|uniref:hypothetical protein n=1 Tax=unclassified Kitasatospora TaxID=2633591 RepID=UPI00369F497C